MLSSEVTDICDNCKQKVKGIYLFRRTEIDIVYFSLCRECIDICTGLIPNYWEGNTLCTFCKKLMWDARENTKDCWVEVISCWLCYYRICKQCWKEQADHIEFTNV